MIKTRLKSVIREGGGGGDGFFLVIGQRGCAVRWGRIMIVLRFQEEWLDETPNIN